MRVLAASLWCLLSVSLLGQQFVPRQGDEAAVREVVKKYVDARELRDPRAIEALFTSDADQRTTSGEWRRGRTEVVPGTLESSQRNAGTRVIKVESVRFLTPDVALVDGPYEISAGPGGAVRQMWTTITLTRAADAWRIAAIRNMVPTSPGASGRP
jgi:uncharacterized protein (TIGR02246 family)